MTEGCGRAQNPAGWRHHHSVAFAVFEAGTAVHGGVWRCGGPGGIRTTFSFGRCRELMASACGNSLNLHECRLGARSCHTCSQSGTSAIPISAPERRRSGPSDNPDIGERAFAAK
jgi:hypothetical protein